MKLGTQTGSLINHVIAGAGMPVIAEGATILHWSDRSPGTVVSFDEQKRMVGVQMDKYQRIDQNGMSEDQNYEYTRDEDGFVYYFRLDKNGWNQVRHNVETNRWNKVNGAGVMFGRRERFYDFTF